MALKKIDFVERAVIVFEQDGSVRAAHQEHYEAVTEGGAILSHQTRVEPLEPATLATLVPDKATLVAQAASLTTALADHAQLARDHEAATATIADQGRELETLRNENVQKVAALEESIRDLRRQLYDALKAPAKGAAE